MDYQVCPYCGRPLRSLYDIDTGKCPNAKVVGGDCVRASHQMKMYTRHRDTYPIYCAVRTPYGFIDATAPENANLQQIELTQVYCMKSLATGLVKIGFSKSPERRLKRIRIDEKDDTVELIAATETDILFEGWAHAVLKKFRVRGEWFSLHSAISELLTDPHWNIYQSL